MEKYIIPNGVSGIMADSLTFDGKIYAAPYSIIYNAIVYNKDVFDKYDLKGAGNIRKNLKCLPDAGRSWSCADGR